MIIDLKYHIASLVAVFLALGLGILIGSTVSGGDAIIEQQQQIADKLEQQLEELRQKNEIMQTEIAKVQVDYNIQKQFEKQALPLMIQGKLKDKSLAIIETNSYSFSDDLINTLHMAGGEVKSVTTVLNDFDAGEKKDEICRELGWGSLNNETFARKMAETVAEGVLKGENLAVLNYLAAMELVNKQGDYGVPLDGVIVVGGSQDKKNIRIKTIDMPIIDYFLARKIPVFGVEKSNVVCSYMNEYQKKRISTVDNVDTIPGQVALVLAISGKPGHYGIKSTAQQLLPAIE